jgi:hypothetical protein
VKLTIRVWFWLETGLASLCALLAVLTVVGRQWFEALTGLDPDRHSGSLEWGIVCGLLAACVVLVFAARHEWRHGRDVLVSPAP